MVPLLKDICCCDPQFVKNFTLSQTKCAQIIKNVIAKIKNKNTIKNLKHQKFSVLLNKSKYH